MPDWDDYLSLAFDEIRTDGAASIQVMRRLRASLAGLASAATDARRKASVAPALAHLDETVRRSDLDRADQAAAR